MKICPQCQKNYPDDCGFCPTCGVQLVEAGPPNPVQQATLPTQGEFHFDSNYYGETTPIRTDVTAQDQQLFITQYKKILFFKFSTQSLTVNINSITSVVHKTKINKTTIFWIIVSIIGLLNSSSLIGALFWIVCGGIITYTTLKKRFLFIYFSNGYVKIPEEHTHSEDMDGLIEYIRSYNPQVIQQIVDN